jgi:hypothetical protein
MITMIIAIVVLSVITIVVLMVKSFLSKHHAIGQPEVTSNTHRGCGCDDCGCGGKK